MGIQWISREVCVYTIYLGHVVEISTPHNPYCVCVGGGGHGNTYAIYSWISSIAHSRCVGQRWPE